NRNVEAGRQEVAVIVREVQVDFGIDGDVTGKRDPLLLRDQPNGAFEAGRPAGREELFGIRARARRAGRRQPDVELSVGTARDAGLTASAGMGHGRVEDLGSRTHGWLLWCGRKNA